MKNKVHNNYIIYKVKNIWTGQVYIGATTVNIKKRKLDHLERARRGERGKFHDALASWTNAFTWTQIDCSCSMDELAEKEKNYIKDYNSKEVGYNSDSGGGIKKTVYQFRVEDGSLVNKFQGLDDAANSVHASKTGIGNACIGGSKTCKGFIWSYSSTFPAARMDERIKGVVQLDSNNVLLAEYRSVAEASRSSGLSKTCISRCCRGEREHTGGFLWKYA
tara:strand:- start:13502 stop:14161 length:660 start_codon:yes stop_codon:yes gene_type:complete